MDFFIFKNLFLAVLDLSCGTQNLCCHMQALSYGVGDLVPCQESNPALYWQCSLNHLTARKSLLEERRRDIRILALQSKAPCESQSPWTLYSWRNLLLITMGNKQRSQDHIWGISLWEFMWCGPFVLTGEPWWLTHWWLIITCQTELSNLMNIALIHPWKADIFVPIL